MFDILNTEEIRKYILPLINSKIKEKSESCKYLLLIGGTSTN